VQLAHFLIIEDKADSGQTGKPKGNAAGNINLEKGPKNTEKKDGTGRSSRKNAYPRITDRLI
jgi:hypothetical protein